MSPFRALAAIHLQGSWNRLRRQSGLAGAPATVAIALFLAVTLLLPLYASVGVLGWVLGRDLEAGDSPMATAFGGLGFTFLAFGAGAVGGITAGSRQLPWETLRGFPVRSFTLFRAELFAGLAEAITLVEVGALLVVCLGAAVSAPAASPFLLLLLLTHTLSLLAVQQIFGSIAQRLSRRLWGMLVLLPLAAVSVPWAAERLAARARGVGADEWGEGFRTVTSWLPARITLDAAQAALAGELGMGQLVVAVALPCVVAAVTTWAAFVLVARERPLAQPEEGGRPVVLWSFSAPMRGIARLQWETLLRSIPGRFGLLMPLFTVILIRGPLAEQLSGRSWTVPAAFGYASLAGTNLLFNQFGLDRHGVKGLFLLPIPTLDLLRGKLLGFVAWQGVQAVMLALLLVLSGHHDAVEILVGVALYGCIFLVLAMVGGFVSVWQPRPLRQNGLRAAQPPLTVLLLMFGTLGVTALVLYGITYGVHAAYPGWELLVLVCIGAVLAGVLSRVLMWNARYLARHRERLVETLGSVG